MQVSNYGKQTNTKPHQKLKFSLEEDQKLISLVNQLGESNWGSIALYMNGRNIRQCRERWKHYLSPEVSNAPWTEMEDILLNQKYAEYGPKWKKIAEFFPNRTYINIKNRFLLQKRHCERLSSQIVEISSELAIKMSNPKKKCPISSTKNINENTTDKKKKYMTSSVKTPSNQQDDLLTEDKKKYQLIFPQIKSQTIETETPNFQEYNFDDFLADNTIFIGDTDDCYFVF